MIRHPLIRFGLFVVAVVLFFFLLSSFGRSLYTVVLVSSLPVFLATAVMLALDGQGPAFIGLSLDPGWWQQTAGGFAIGWISVGAVAGAMLASGQLQWHAEPVDV